MDIYSNIYNKKQTRSTSKFKIWKSAGLMLTYKCSAACTFCYYNCSPEKDSLMPVETAINSWISLKKLAGEAAKVHITGGEPFLYFDRLLEILQAAKAENLGELDQLETNAGWAVNEKITRQKLGELAKWDIKTLKISCDPFHTEYIDIENIRRLVDIATEILGESRVLVRWQEYLESPVLIKNASGAVKMLAYRENFEKYPFRFTARAANVLGKHFADKTIAEISRQNCKKAFRDSKGVHIDPSGNIFSGVCSGIIIGNVNQTPLHELWGQIDWDNFLPCTTLFNHGPAGLFDEARHLGYRPRDNYASKCHLCTDLRQFFFDIGRYNKIIGPIQCYEDDISRYRELHH